MNYLMAPLDKHYDDGFGATALAFYEAAQALQEREGPRVFLEHLPENYLLRHAVELFLKSGIIIIHRTLKIPFGNQPSTSEPMVNVAGDWKPFCKVHSIAKLYEHWKGLIAPNADALRELCKFKPDWSIPPELDVYIDTIEKTDPGSTYYRYPVTREAQSDNKKSSFKEVPLTELFPKNMPQGKYVKALVVKNEEGEWIRAFAYDESTEKAATEALNNAAKILNDYHAMMRIELTGGW